MTESVPCNLCGGVDERPLYAETYELGGRQLDLRLVQCAHCGLVYTSPRPTRATLARVYSEGEHGTVSHAYCWSSDRTAERFVPVLDELARLVPEGRLLDVGCGSGAFLSSASRRGLWELHGVEPSAAAVKRLPVALAPLVAQGTLDEARFAGGSFDAVTCWYVLEHVSDPAALLREIGRVLKPEGIFFLEVPNFHYLRLKDAGPLCWLRTGQRSRLHLEEHLYQYTPRSMRALLERAGFEVLGTRLARPFLLGHPLADAIKRVGYVTLRLVKSLTGATLGGIQIVARCGTASTAGAASGAGGGSA